MKKLDRLNFVLRNVVDTSLAFCKRNSTTILSLVSSAGVILTGISAANSTKKACRAIAAESFDEWRNGDDISKIEKVRIALPYCIAPTIICAATITCIFGTNAVSKKQQAAYISAYALLESTFKEYREKVNNLYGENADEITRASIREDKHKGSELSFTGEKQTFYEEHYGDFFELSMEEVLDAEYHINRNLALRGTVSLNEFLAFLGLDPIDGGEILGWDLNIGSAYYGYNWIDFCHKKYILDDGFEYILIETPFPPHPEIDDDGKYLSDKSREWWISSDVDQLANYA